MKVFTFVFLGIIFSAFSEDSHVDKLQNLIKKTQPQTLDVLIKNLSKEDLCSYTLMHKSSSSQEGSEKFPRVIAYGEDASIIYSFNGDPKHTGYFSLEIAIALPNGDLELRKITQSGEGNGKLQLSEANPPTCLKCHGNPPRWIWNQYQFWPGAYGDTARGEGSPNIKDIAKFKIGALKHERYRHLPDLLPLDSNLFGGVRQPYSPGPENSNTYFGTLLSRRFAKMQFNRFWNSTAKEFRYALAALLYDCKISGVDQEKLVQKLKIAGAKLKTSPSNPELVLAILSLASVSMEDIRYPHNEPDKSPQVSVLDYFDGFVPSKYYFSFFLAEKLSQEQAALKKWMPKQWIPQPGIDDSMEMKKYFGTPEKIALSFKPPSDPVNNEDSLAQIKSVCTIFTNNLFAKEEVKSNKGSLLPKKHP